MAKYANYQKVCDVLFVIFTLLWITTRLGIYPMWIIYRYVCPLYLNKFSLRFQIFCVLFTFGISNWCYVALHEHSNMRPDNGSAIIPLKGNSLQHLADNHTLSHAQSCLCPYNSHVCMNHIITDLLNKIID